MRRRVTAPDDEQERRRDFCSATKPALFCSSLKDCRLSEWTMTSSAARGPQLRDRAVAMRQNQQCAAGVELAHQR